MHLFFNIKLSQYLHFYQDIEKYIPSLLLVSFETGTQNPNLIVTELKRKYGVQFNVVDDFEFYMREIELARKGHFLPSKERDQLKHEISQFWDQADISLKNKVDQLYHRMIAFAI